MAKKITIPYNGKTYTLEFTREVVKHMESQGFRITEIDNMPMTMITALFNGAFEANHPAVKGATKEKIFGSLKRRKKLIQTLAEMYADTYNTLFDDDEDEADEENPGWGVTE